MTGDISLNEKRIYGEKRETTVAFVASAAGLARVAVSGDQVGRIGLVRREPIRDVAGADGRLLVGTADDALVGTADGFEQTGFGPAQAVGIAGDDPLAVDPDGRIARLDGDDWHPLGRVETPRRFDGRYLATGDGLVRIGEAGGIGHLGLADVRDVAAAGPLAATADGLLERVDGEWVRVRDGPHAVVAADGEHVHAVDGDGLHEGVDGGWTRCDLPVEGRVADVAYGESPYAVTADGTFLVDADPEATPDGESGWRHRSLGVPDVRAVAVP